MAALETPGAACIFSGGHDGALRQWDAQSGSLLRTCTREGVYAMIGCIRCICVHEGRAYVGHADGQLNVWEIAIECKLGCGATLNASAAASHYECSCPHRMVVCTGCGDEVMAKRMPSHECLCPALLLHCECGWSGHPDALPKHKVSECPLRLVGCKLLCGAEPMAKDEAAHYAACPKREVTCTRGCGIPRLTFCRQVEHERNECPHRPVPCKWNCGDSPRAVDLHRHQSQLCPNRLCECELGCGEWLPAHLLPMHQAELCPMIPADPPPAPIVPCLLGCGAHMTEAELPAHVEAECPLRPMQCRLGCGETPTAIDRQKHEQEQCSLRIVPCTHAKQGCLVELMAKDVAAHAAQCPYRIVECPSGCGIKGLMAFQAWGHTTDIQSMRPEDYVYDYAELENGEKAKVKR